MSLVVMMEGFLHGLRLAEMAAERILQALSVEGLNLAETTEGILQCLSVEGLIGGRPGRLVLHVMMCW